MKRRGAAIARAQRKMVDAEEELRNLIIHLPYHGSTNASTSKTSEAPPAADKQIIKAGFIDDSSHKVILVESDNLGDVLTSMSMSSSPSVYDFQCQEMKYSDRGNPTIISNGVTWRNGNIMLSSEQSLNIEAEGVVMELISVLNGNIGVHVTCGGSLLMTECKISDSGDGLYVNASSSVIANNLKIINCRVDCITVWDGSSAVVTGCELSGAGAAGICMSCNSCMEGTGITIVGAQTNVLNLAGTAKLSLTECKMIRNPGSLGVVNGEATLKLLRCAIDGEFEKGEDATIEIKR